MILTSSKQKKKEKQTIMLEWKSLRLKKLLSGRVIRNTKGFGWLVESKQTTAETTTWVDDVDAEHIYGKKWKFTPHYKSDTKYFLDVDFSRDDVWYKNLGSIKVLEFFYNVFFLLRRIIGSLVPIAFAIFLVYGFALGFNSNGDTTLMIVGMPFMIGFIAWIFLMILETTFSAIARSILKPADEYAESLRRISGGHSGYGDDISVPKKIFLSILSLVFVVAGFFVGGAIGSEVRYYIMAQNGGAGLFQSQVPQMITFFVGVPLILFTAVMTMIKIWKGRTSRVLFMLLNILVTAALTFLVMIFTI